MPDLLPPETEPAPHGASPHGDDHARAHASHAHYHPTSVRRMAVALGVAVTILVAEALGGWFSHSLALLSDAGHMLTDALALGLAMVALVFGGRPADLKRTFGFRRLEVLAAQINAITLLGITVWVVYEALERLRHPPQQIHVAVMAAVAGVGVLGNGIVLLALHEERGLNARSAFLHVLGDAVASVGVLAGAGVIWLRPELQWVDPALSIGIALLILWGAVQLIGEVTDVLMEAVPRHLDVERVTAVMAAPDGVVAVHDLHIWTISSGMYALSAHLVVKAEKLGCNDEILTQVKQALNREFHIDHTTLQIESAQYAHVDDVHKH